MVLVQYRWNWLKKYYSQYLDKCIADFGHCTEIVVNDKKNRYDDPYSILWLWTNHGSILYFSLGKNNTIFYHEIN